MFLEHLIKTANIVRDNNFDNAELEARAVWDNGDHYRICFNRLVVANDGFWFSALPKHPFNEVETRQISFHDLAKYIIHFTEALSDGRLAIFVDLDREMIDEIKTLSI